jgi:glycosyltransferase involved in cell wall biosynthesis
MKNDIAIITPTFNRADKLSDLYYSLLKQDNLNFTWYVIDDGSTDNTSSFITDIRSKSPFKIFYLYCTNRGKGAALNYVMPYVEERMTFIVDSDDYLTKDAISIIYSKLSSNTGLVFRRINYQNGEFIGNKLDINFNNKIYSSFNRLATDVGGDVAIVVDSQLLKEIRFIDIPGDNFSPELITWDVLGRNKSYILYSDIGLYICNYYDDGYTKNFQKYLKNNILSFFVTYVYLFKIENNIILKFKYFLRIIQALFIIRYGK